jgi:hypothetical protein
MKRNEETVEVDADLSVSVPPAGLVGRSTHREARVWSDGSKVTVETPSFAVARELFSGVTATPFGPDRVGEAISDLGVTVRIRVRHATVATVGREANPGPIGRRVGFGAELDPKGALAALARWP